MGSFWLLFAGCLIIFPDFLRFFPREFSWHPPPPPCGSTRGTLLFLGFCNSLYFRAIWTLPSSRAATRSCGTAARGWYRPCSTSVSAVSLPTPASAIFPRTNRRYPCMSSSSPFSSATQSVGRCCGLSRRDGSFGCVRSRRVPDRGRRLTRNARIWAKPCISTHLSHPLIQVSLLLFLLPPHPHHRRAEPAIKSIIKRNK